MRQVNKGRRFQTSLVFLFGVAVFSASTLGYFCYVPGQANVCSFAPINTTRTCGGVACPDLILSNPVMPVAAAVEDAPGSAGVLAGSIYSTCHIQRRRCSGSSCVNTTSPLYQVQNTSPNAIRCGPPPEEF